MNMKNRKRFVAFTLVAGFLLISCSFPTWLASEISEYISPYLPTSTETIQQPVTETAQPAPSQTSQPLPTQTTESEAVQVIDRTFFAESDDPRYEIDGVWPNLGGPESVTATFNDESDRLTQEVMDDFLLVVGERALESEGSGEAPLSTLTFNYELTYSDQFIFSFYLLFDQYIAMSAHPFSFSNSLNYDALEGEFIQLADLFLLGVDHIDALESYIDPILIDRDFGYEAGTAGVVMAERENWNLLPEGLRINFDVYEVAPYAAGPQYILIPWGDLSGILDSAGPAGSFIE
jgi:hypothetical protein